jgi:glycine oxidase
MIIVIGGGIFGLAIGWSLARAGRPVTLLERDEVGQGATYVAAGMLMPWKLSNSFNQDLFILQWESHQRWPQFAQDLRASAEVNFTYQTDGRYFVALDEKAQKRLQKQYQFHHRLGFSLEWLTSAEARRRESALGPKVQAAIFSPLGHRVDSRRLIVALKQAFLRAGGILREQTPVLDILIEGNRVSGVRLVSETLQAETVILAAGAWSGQLGGLPVSLRSLIQPLKGQTLTLHMPSGPLLHHPVIGPVYLVPRPDDTLLLGTTVEEEAGFDLQPTVAGVLDILNKAQEIVPGIRELPLINMEAGLRPTGPDRLPVLGPTGVEGLIMASGGHSYGILLAPIVAQAITQLVLTNQMPDLIRPFTIHNPIFSSLD